AEFIPSFKDQGLVASTAEDPYAFLYSFNIVVLINDSGSMKGTSWNEVRLALRDMIPICVAHDADGIDLYFMNHKRTDKGDTSAGQAPSGYRGINLSKRVDDIFSSISPRGATPTGQRLQLILKPYLGLLKRKRHDIDSVKPLNIFVITDGAASDDVEGPIITAAKKLDKLDAPSHQLRIQFFQVGNEPGAKEDLRELDDELEDKSVRDIVDTVTWEGGQVGKLSANQMITLCLGAMVKQLDRKPARGEGDK
ncbi:hypothetical protein COL922a_010406, partial [Colletotrichum nupharicola]